MALAYIDGTPFWYNVAGEQGTPVILIMGFATRGNAWDIQIKGLEGKHQVMWYDHRGIGESGQPNPVFTMKDMARDVVGLHGRETMARGSYRWNFHGRNGCAGSCS